jgi:hypothetical protein
MRKAKFSEIREMGNSFHRGGGKMYRSIGQYEQGLKEGEMLKEAIEHNLRRFWAIVTLRWGRNYKETLINAAVADGRRLRESTLVTIQSMSRGAGILYEELLAFNLFSEMVDPEGCTVMAAMGDSTRDGSTIFFKQSDKRGAKDLTGPKSYMQKEINVVRIEKGDQNHNKIIGVTAAGSAMFKMGLNEKGVANGSNLARIKRLRDETVGYFGGGGRGEYMQQGLLEGKSAVEAANIVLPQLVSNPVSSPGNIEYADAKIAVVLECSFTELACEWHQRGVLARANRFEVMRHLNQDGDDSSRLRYDRAMNFLEENKGKITIEKMMEIAVDHKNGPSLNSICRHSSNWEDETSLSSAIMRIDPKEPMHSEIYLALGKPCRAWATKEGEGWIKLSMESTEANVPEKFLTGENFIRYYSE